LLGSLGALAVGCSPHNQANYATAAVAVAAAVTEAAVQRAVTGDCWSTCAYGTHCDSASGTCVSNEVWPSTPASATALPTAEDVPPPSDDTCAGYCADDERCVVVANGDLECVPRKTPSRATR